MLFHMQVKIIAIIQCVLTTATQPNAGILSEIADK